MARWDEFATEAPELAAFGVETFRRRVAFLATVRPDGSPRVHPVTPIIAEGRLFVFMERTSPKGHDLRRDGRYALHGLVSDEAGSGGEFYVRGQAAPLDDAPSRALAARAAGYTVADRHVLFELGVDGAMSTVYRDGEPLRQRWGRP